jgi:hypothetical protein
MVVNDDPGSSYDVTLAVPGYKLATGAPVIFYGPSSSHLQVLTGPAAAAAAHTTAPYSVTVYTLTRH